jgi:branched-chain amino acid transport system ATP-binding protein
MTAALLEVRDIHKHFGALAAVSGISVTVAEHEVVGVIGANGAGKTTFVNMVTGYLAPTSGTIAFHGRDITGRPPRQVLRLGIARSFQVPQVFATATVLDNLLIAFGIAEDGTLPVWRPLRRRERVERAIAMLEAYGIAGYGEQAASLLPQGVRKLLDIAMATVRGPELLLLDEPTSGISAGEKFAIMDTIMAALRAQKSTVLFIEHDMEIIGRYARRVLAFANGFIIADGPPQAVIADPEVRRLVVGEPGGHAR